MSTSICLPPSCKQARLTHKTGNTGLGKETVLQLAKHSPKEIFLAARTPSKAEAAITDIKNAVPRSNITFLQMDLTSFASIKKAADEFTTRSDRLDLLINNAGVMALPYSKTKEGYEIQFGTNHMGHSLLTKLLLPTLLRTAEESNSDVRVINVSSMGHQMAPGPGIIYDQDALEHFSTWRRYGQSKLADLLTARSLQQHYPSLTATSVHPGVIATDLYSTSMGGGIMGAVWKFMSLFLIDVPHGTRTQLWAATGPREKVRESYYFVPYGKKSGGSFWHAQKPKLADELWEWTEKELVRQGY